MQLMQLLPGKCSATEASRARWYVAESAAPPPMLWRGPDHIHRGLAVNFHAIDARVCKSASIKELDHVPNLVWTRFGSLNGR